MARARHTGQSTVQVKLSESPGIKEGSMLEVRVDKGCVVMKARPPLGAGRVVGKGECEKVIRDLGEQRRNWG